MASSHSQMKAYGFSPSTPNLSLFTIMSFQLELSRELNYELESGGKRVWVRGDGQMLNNGRDLVKKHLDHQTWDFEMKHLFFPRGSRLTAAATLPHQNIHKMTSSHNTSGYSLDL